MGYHIGFVGSPICCAATWLQMQRKFGNVYRQLDNGVGAMLLHYKVCLENTEGTCVNALSS